MSKLQIYTIRDKKMGTHLRPMYVPHLVEIQRNLITVLQDEKSTIAKFPSDYELYQLGTFDEETAVYELETKPTFIMNMTDLKESDGKL